MHNREKVRGELLAPIALSAALVSCTVTDGDTLRCGPERVRLLGIDAPEMPSHCRKGRDCAPGDPYASKAALVRAIGTAKVRLVRVGTDRYGRTLAVAYAGTVNLSCAQLAAGQAIYKPRWDTGGRIGRECPGRVPPVKHGA
ncbi:MAG: thermonuclease family protein [Novosphingobium sp.]|nr:thermonuclease family protein [Novosphingobium sp.]